jgi:hypothetical protein
MTPDDLARKCQELKELLFACLFIFRCAKEGVLKLISLHIVLEGEGYQKSKYQVN